MPEEERKQPEQTPGESPEPNGASDPQALATIKAELEEEKKAIAAAQAAIHEKDALITDLQAKLTAANQGSEAAAAELTQLKGVHGQAVAKYLDAVRSANPGIPGDIITGATIDEIDASVAKALSIATVVKASLEAEAKQARVPAGAPPRGDISLEGLSPREKIAAGLQQGSQR